MITDHSTTYAHSFNDLISTCSGCIVKKRCNMPNNFSNVRIFRTNIIRKYAVNFNRNIFNSPIYSPSFSSRKSSKNLTKHKLNKGC